MCKNNTHLTKRLKDGLAWFIEILNMVKLLLVALLAVLVAFYAFYDEIMKKIFPAKPPVEIIDITKLRPLKRKEISIENIRVLDNTIVLETLPLYLENSDLKNRFDWLNVRAENLTENTLTMVIKLVKVSGVIVDLKPMEYHTTIAPGQKDFLQKYRPDKYDILSADNNDRQAVPDNSVLLEVSVKEKDTSRQIHQKQYELKGLRVNEFKWGLKKLDGKKIPPEDLIASLTAWSTTKDPSLTHYNEELNAHAAEKSGLGKRMNPSAINHFFEKMYNDIIKGKRIVTGKPVFEDSEITSIQRPQTVLRELKENSAANALETGLLIGALTMKCSDELKIPIILLIRFDDEGDDYMIAWSVSKIHRTWKGLDWEGFSLINNEGSYEENKKNTQAEIPNIMNRHVLSSLKKDGAYYKESELIALYYKDAAKKHVMMGLP